MLNDPGHVKMLFIGSDTILVLVSLFYMIWTHSGSLNHVYVWELVCCNNIVIHFRPTLCTTTTYQTTWMHTRLYQWLTRRQPRIRLSSLMACIHVRCTCSVLLLTTAHSQTVSPIGLIQVFFYMPSSI